MATDVGKHRVFSVMADSHLTCKHLSVKHLLFANNQRVSEEARERAKIVCQVVGRLFLEIHTRQDVFVNTGLTC